MKIDYAGVLRSLRETFRPVVHVCLSDVTDGHTVAGARDGRARVAGSRELLLLLVSDSFH